MLVPLQWVVIVPNEGDELLPTSQLPYLPRPEILHDILW